jgi:hypothetical protein
MKKLLLVLLTTLISITGFSQICYTVKDIDNKGNIEGINPKRFTLGVKQITEEILSEKYSVCENGLPVSVVIESIEAPTTGMALGPFEFKRKKTIVTLKVIINETEYLGVGENSTDVKSTFIELQDENIPFEKSAFSAGLKKALLNAISKI